MMLSEVSSDLLEELLPDIFSPMRGYGVQHESLVLDPVQHQVLVHSADCGRGLAVGISCGLELIETGLEGKFV